jgi:probable rRNA maturation factor
MLEMSLVGSRRIRSLKRVHLGKDQVTDVLSFPMDWRRPNHGGPWLLGEIIVALPVAERQARRANRTLADQIVRLAVHGYVHLSGRDHEKSRREAGRFHGEERRVLAMLRRKGLMQWDGTLQF